MAHQSTLALTQRTKYLFILCISFLPIFSLMIAVFLSSFRPLFVNLENIVEKSLREIRPVHQLQISLVNAVMPPNDYLVHGSTRELYEWNTSKQEVEAAFSKVLNTSRLSSARDEISVLRKEWRTTSRYGDQLFRDLSEHRIAHPLANEMEEFDSRVVAMTLHLNDLIDRLEEECLEHYNRIHRLKTQGLLLSLGAVLTGFLAGILGTIWLTRDRQKMVVRSLSDPLTKILNRRALERELANLHAACEKKLMSVYSILMMDMDNFKQINDTHGHAAGDLVLKRFAQKTRKVIRGSDIFGRFGGEEFLLVLPETHRQEAFALAERIRKAISRTPVSIPETQEEVRITVSIGLATFPTDDSDAEGVIRAADEAMYRAKTGGRNQVVCSGKDRLSIRDET